MVVLAVAGTTLGYAALASRVTLSLDGQTEQVQRHGWHRRRRARRRGHRARRARPGRPRLDEQVERRQPHLGAVRPPARAHRRRRHHDLLGELHRRRRRAGRDRPRFDGADLSTSRGGRSTATAWPSRSSPRRAHLQIGDQKPVKRKVTALTVADALDELGVKVDKHDRMKPAARPQIEDGDKIVFTDIRIVTKHVKGEAIDFEHRRARRRLVPRGRRPTSSAPARRRRNVTYQLTYRNGELDRAQGRRARVSRQPVDRDRRGRHQGRAVGAELRRRQHRLGRARPVRVRRQLGHQHRQRLLRRPAVQPRHLAGLRRHRPPQPEQLARTQIAIATKLRDASGGYGAWPGCAAQARACLADADRAHYAGTHV